MSGQVDSQVFVCISDFAGWPQVGKLLKGFTLLPNFLLHKRGTITTSNLVGISIVSKRCFFQLVKKGYFSALSLLIFVLPLLLMVFNQNLQFLDITQNSDNILHTDFISSARSRCGGKGGKEEGCERGQGDQFGEYPSFCQLDFCVTQLKLDTVEKLSSSIFCCLSVCQASVSPDQISTFSNIYRHTNPLLTQYNM